MKKIALITALVASVAAPAFAQSALEVAVQNYNASAEGTSDQIVLAANELTMGTTASSRSGSALAQAIANHNASADTASDRIDPNFVTVFTGTPAHAADIFARLAEESRGED